MQSPCSPAAAQRVTEMCRCGIERSASCLLGLDTHVHELQLCERAYASYLPGASAKIMIRITLSRTTSRSKQPIQYTSINPKFIIAMKKNNNAHDQLENVSNLWGKPLCAAVMLVPNTKPIFSLLLFSFFAFLFIKNNGFEHWKKTPPYLMAIFLFHTFLGLSFILFSFFAMSNLKLYLNIYLFSLISCAISTTIFVWLYGRFLKGEDSPFKTEV